MHHPAWDFALRATPSVVELLYHARTPIDRGELAMRVPDVQTGAEVIKRLVDLGVLIKVENQGALAGEPRPPIPWNYWGYKTWVFHAYAHRTVFLHDESGIWFEKARRMEPDPGRVARWAGRDDDVKLASYHGDDSVAKVFAERRTTRAFAARPLPLADLARMVSETFRIRGIIDADFFGEVPIKSYPSSGARHEIDLYVIAFDVLDLPSGVYYYDDYRDTFVNTGLVVDREMLEACSAKQGIAHASPAVLVAVCQSERIAWKYRGPRGYLDVYVNVGHAMQNAILYAQSLGLRSWLSTAIDTARLGCLLKLRHAEFPTAVLGIGLPETADQEPIT